MPRKISPHAATLLTLINNAAALAVIRSEYGLSRDVIRALKKMCDGFGFEVDNDVFDHILSCIGSKNPLAMKAEFDKFSAMILNIDKKLDKESNINYGKHK